jgi:hypothetical protein
MESKCLVDTTNFIKTKNHFNLFWIYLHFSICCDLYFWHKYSWPSHHIKFKNVVSLEFDLFGFWPTIICKKIVKSFIIMTWLKFKHGSLKTIQLWQQICPPSPSVLSPMAIILIHISKNIVKDALIDRKSWMNMISSQLKIELGLWKLNPTPYNFSIVDQKP